MNLLQGFDLPVVTNQTVHQVFQLVRLTIQHNQLLQRVEVLGLQQFLMRSTVANEG